jgi:tripartite-type tricarboxylate transporter receptor subunit TctC
MNWHEARLVGLKLIALGAAIAFSVGSASAQTWPTRAVTIVVPFAAGTTSDVVARAFADHLAKAIGQSIVIDNRGGAAGNIGAAIAAKAAPDGQTLLLATTAQLTTNKLMYKDMGFDPQRDFTPVVLVGRSPIMIVGGPKAPVTSIKDVISYSRANPGQLTAGYNGAGLLGHITGEMLQARAKIKFVAVHYRGSASIITDLLGGHIQIAMNSMGAYVPSVKNGKLRALAIASHRRWPDLPDVPTVAESGVPGFEASVWYALMAPIGTSPAIIDRLNAALNEFLAMPEAQDTLKRLGIEVAGGSPEDLNAYIASETAKWEPIIKAAGLTLSPNAE